ncbi:MAG: histidinol dehydrogenase [Balneolales bacterium]
MEQYIYSALTKVQLDKLCRRPAMNLDAAFDIVKPIIEDVRDHGDEAVLDLTERFDKVRPVDLTIPIKPISEIPVQADVAEALDTAYANIYQFHKAQYPDKTYVETMPGVICSRVARPIERVGLYVPGGTAVLPSSLLMLGVPAKIAGCEEIVVATPPRLDGTVAPEIEYIASLIGAACIVKAGGAQAVAAMAYGTGSIPKVDKILGPGNRFVTAAKMLLQNSDAMVSIDMPAGPSEVLVIADKQSNPAFVAADLLSQAEHGPDSQVVLVGIGDVDFDAIEREIKRQNAKLQRAETSLKALENSFIIQTANSGEALAFSNRYAPEHLIINCEDAEQLSEHVKNAGSVFIGPWSAESVGDYASGTNHTLPTYGFARMYSGVSLDSYYKHITMQQLSEEGLKNIAKTVTTMADIEGLDAHKNAVEIRLNSNS